MKGPVPMIGRIVGAALGGAISKQQHGDPVKGAIIGAATMFVARRFLPARLATLGAAVAAGYVGRKLAQRAERQASLPPQLPAPADTPSPVMAAPVIAPPVTTPPANP